MKRDYKIYLKDILKSMESIEKFVENMSFGEFRGDDKTSSVVIRKMENEIPVIIDNNIVKVFGDTISNQKFTKNSRRLVILATKQDS